MLLITSTSDMNCFLFIVFGRKILRLALHITFMRKSESITLCFLIDSRLLCLFGYDLQVISRFRILQSSVSFLISSRLLVD